MMAIIKLSESEIFIDYLKYHPDVLPELASIWYNVLGSIWYPHTPIQNVINRFQKHLNIMVLPLTLVAFSDERPVGMCSLRKRDDVVQDLSPSLGSLVVHPDYQRRGIAVKLIQAVKEKARELNYKELFLIAFEQKLVKFYSKLGWEITGMDSFQGIPVTIMRIDI